MQDFFQQELNALDRALGDIGLEGRLHELDGVADDDGDQGSICRYRGGGDPAEEEEEDGEPNKQAAAAQEVPANHALARQSEQKPVDKMKLVRMIAIILGIGTLTPWNMFITATNYFIDYKLAPPGTPSWFVREPKPPYPTTDGDADGLRQTDDLAWYRGNFMFVLTFASQLPNIIFTWLNVFVQIGGGFRPRILIACSLNIVLFIATIMLAVINTEGWPIAFFWVTMAIVMVMNAANAIFQNTVYGVIAPLPPIYTGAIVLGNNISGTFTSIVNIISLVSSPNVRVAAILYFSTAVVVLVMCIVFYIFLDKLEYYKWHITPHNEPSPTSKEAFPSPREDADGDAENGDNISSGELVKTDDEKKEERPPMTKMQMYMYTWKQCYMQGINAFLVFFVTLSVFPTVMAGVDMSDPNFFTGPVLFRAIITFLTFNVTAMLGNILPSYLLFPKPKFLIIPVVLRSVLIPLFMLCNFQPLGVVRKMPVLFKNDYIFWLFAILLGFSNGYYASLAMMYGPMTVEPDCAPVAGMLCGACLVSGVFGGILFSSIPKMVVANIG